jgi:transposase-like protein
MKQVMLKYTTKDFENEFPNDDACLEWIFNHRWPDGLKCSHCGRVKFHKVKSRKVYECECGHQVSPTVGTIFHKSPTPLRLWFYAMYLMASTRCGISAKQIQRETGVTYKTAWRMFKQIRDLLREKEPFFFGDVEADETYVGGKRPGKRGRGAAGKTPVVGIVERKGKVAAKVTGDLKSSTVKPFIVSHVAPQSKIYTDEYPVYNDLPKYGYEHESVNHNNEEYVRGDAHTNSIEGFWSLMKRGVNGVYHAVSPKYLQSYVNEYAFRYNHRKDEQPMFVSFLNQI